MNNTNHHHQHQHQHQSQSQYHHNNKHQRAGRTNLASCIVATIFLIFIAIVILIVFFTVFKPKDPQISVKAVQLPAFSISNSTVNFTFSQYSSVRNPNRAEFTHYDSSLQLVYSGNQIGFMFIPSGKIDAGRTKYMSAIFSVQSFPLNVRVGGVGPTSTSTSADAIDVTSGLGLGPTLEIELKMKMAGRVKVLQFFTHHVETRIGCRVAIAVHDGTVVGFHC